MPNLKCVEGCSLLRFSSVYTGLHGVCSTAEAPQLFCEVSRWPLSPSITPGAIHLPPLIFLSSWSPYLTSLYLISTFLTPSISLQANVEHKLLTYISGFSNTCTRWHLPISEGGNSLRRGNFQKGPLPGKPRF